MELFFKSNFENIVAFGIRNEPRFFTGKCSNQILLFLTTSCTINQIRIENAKVYGSRESITGADQEGPRLARSASMSSISTALIGNLRLRRDRYVETTAIPLISYCHVRTKVITIPMPNSNSFVIAFVMDSREIKHFKPKELTFKLVSGSISITSRIPLHSYTVIVGTLCPRMDKINLSTSSIYASFFRGLNSMIDNKNFSIPLDALFWMHGIALSFIHDLTYELGGQPIDLSTFLCLLNTIWTQDSSVTHPALMLLAVGHGLGLFDANELKRSISTEIKSLWNVASNFLVQNKEYIENFAKFMKNLAFQMALIFLWNEDLNKLVPPPSYASFRGVLPLMHLLHFVRNVDLTTIRCKFLENPRQLSWEAEIRSCTPANLIYSGSKHLDFYVDQFLALIDCMDANAHFICNEFATATEQIDIEYQIWKSAFDIVFLDANYDSSLSFLRQKILLNNAGASAALEKNLMETFRDAIIIWKVLFPQSFQASLLSPVTIENSNISGDVRQCVTDPIRVHESLARNEIERFYAASVESRMNFDAVTPLKVVAQQTINVFHDIAKDIYIGRNANMKKSLLKTLHDLDYIFTYPNVVNEGFVSLFPDSPFADRQLLVSAEAICLVLNEDTKESASVIVTDGNLVRHVRTAIAFTNNRQIVAGNLDAGCAVGPKSISRLRDPKGVCVFSVAGPTARKINLAMAVSDTGNNRIVMVAMSTENQFCDEVTLLAGNSEAGFKDGIVANARFFSPAGLLSLEKSLLVCDTNNHIIRRIACNEESNMWFVHTVVGRPEQAGTQDGDILQATLTSPYQMAYCEKTFKLYFTEQCTNPSVRCCHLQDRGDVFDKAVVSTVYRGSPFVHLNGICVGVNTSLLVCDSGAGCIWSINLHTGDLSVKISAESIYRTTYHLCESQETFQLVKTYKKTAKSTVSPVMQPAESFSPLSIVHLNHQIPGYYIFSDKNSKQCMYKYFDPELVIAEQTQLKSLYDDVQRAKTDAIHAIENYSEAIVTSSNSIAQAFSVPFSLRCKAFETNFINELKSMEIMNHELESKNLDGIHFSIFMSMLKNAPTLYSAVEVTRTLIRINYEKTKMLKVGGVLGGENNFLDRGVDFINKDFELGGLCSGSNGSFSHGFEGGFESMGVRPYDATDIETSSDLVNISSEDNYRHDYVQCVVDFLTQRDFSAKWIKPSQELDALLQLIKLCPCESATTVLSAALHNTSFMFELSIQLLDIFRFALDKLSKLEKLPTSREYSFKRPAYSNNDQAREDMFIFNKAVLIWVTRLLPYPKSYIEQSFESFVDSAFQFWTNILPQLTDGQPHQSMKHMEWDDLSMFQNEFEYIKCESSHTVSVPTKTYMFSPDRNRFQEKVVEAEINDVRKQIWTILVCMYFEDLCAGQAVVSTNLQRDSDLRFKFVDVTSTKSLMFLEHIPRLCMSNKAAVHEVIAQISSMVACRYVNPTKAVISLLRAVTHVSQTASNCYDPDSFYHIFHYVLDHLTKKAFEELLDVEQRSIWVVQFRLTTVHPEFWSHLLDWHYNPKYTDRRSDSREIVRLEGYCAEIVNLATLFSECIIRGHVDVKQLESVKESYQNLKLLWKYVGSPLANERCIYNLTAEISACHNEISVIREILLLLMPESPELTQINNILQNWDGLFLVGIRNLLHLKQPELFNVDNVAFGEAQGNEFNSLKNKIFLKPLPVILCVTSEWLEVACKSEMFRRFWRDQSGIGSVSDISPVIGKWCGLFTAIANGESSLLVCDRYGEFLMNKNEVLILARTVRSYRILSRLISNEDDIDAAAGATAPFNLSLCDDSEDGLIQMTHVIETVIDHWSHVQLFFVNKEYAEAVLSAARHHTIDAVHIHISSFKTSLESLCELIESNGPWESQPLRLVEQYWLIAKDLDSRLLKVSFQLLHTIQNNIELIDWLRTIKDDEVFASSIEMARSLQEMNAPMELWDSLSGRVNERFLSMISNVRGYLHSYLYDSDRYIHSIDVFLKTFSSFNTKIDTDQIIKNITVCFDVRKALAKIIGTRTDVSGSSRLGHLYSAGCSSIWRCSRNDDDRSSENDGTVSLRYKMEDVNEEEGFVWRQHLFNDLQEFQSNILLEKSLVFGNSLGADEMESVAIDTFLAQFREMRRLSDALDALYNSGHFEYNTNYLAEFSVSTEENVIRKNVLELESVRVSWEKHVDRIRGAFYYINFLDLKRCYNLIRLIRSVADSAYTEEDYVKLFNAVQQYTCFINSEMSANSELMREVTNMLVETWTANTIGTESESKCGEDRLMEDILAEKSCPPSSHLLTRFALALDKAFSIIPCRSRYLNVAGIDRYVVNERISRGIFVAFGKTLKQQYDQLVTVQAIQGRFFEWESCLVCSKSTTLEQVATILHRWHRSYLHEREKITYALIEIDKLAYDVQFGAVQILRNLRSLPTDMRGPLILIAESGDNCYFASQYQHNRLNNGTLPPQLLTDVSIELQKQSCGLMCYVSSIPGAGKSFDIRLQAAEQNLRYMHIPINNPFTPPNILIQRLHEVSHDQLSRVLIHFDIASTCGQALIGVIFNICVLGVLADNSTDLLFSYHPKHTAISIELSSGLQFDSFSQFAFYPTIEKVASSVSFCLDREVLESGMGHEFSATLYGNVSENKSNQINPSNAYDRLYYVIEVLKVLDANGGAFPAKQFNADFVNAASRQGMPIATPRDVCFSLLMQASRLSANPSLWCVWSFINVLYWQLQEIESKSSPVYLACLPDDHIKLMTLEFDLAMKATVKGGLIGFIITTAREFATRQTSEDDDNSPDRVIGVLVKKFKFIQESRTQNINNLFWKREKYDTDGRPVFKSPQFSRGPVAVVPAAGGAAPQPVGQPYHLYIHYRESENRWVIDDTVNYTGGVIAYSVDAQPIELTRFELRTLKGREVRVNVSHQGVGTVSETVTLSGFENCRLGLGSVVGPDDNGVYFRDSMDINNQKHYVKSNPTRHLYALAASPGVKAQWVVAKTCNAEVMGSHAYSREPKLETGLWMYFPPNSQEGKAVIKVVKAGTALEDLMRENVALNHSQHFVVGQAEVNIRNNIEVTKADATLDSDMVMAELECAGLHVKLTRWKDSNHECIFFNNETGSVHFLSLDRAVLRDSIHPILLKHLESNEIVVGDDLKSTTDPDKYWALLIAITGVRRSRAEMTELFSKSFVLTGDSLLKILAIIYRVKCKIPVVLLGECGCGKTMLLSFLCKWLGVQLLTLDVHGGTTEKEIIDIFTKAQSMLLFHPNSNATVFIFLDEVNTCAHMGLLNEAICHRSIEGKRIHDGIQILAALNPYRLRPKKLEIGLTFDKGHNPLDDPMNRLVYRVHPIPATLKDFIFDFGSLEPDTELLYIQSMVKNDPQTTKILVTDSSTEFQALEDRNTITMLVHRCQCFVREVEGDPSVVSLRDVKRTLHLMSWFYYELPDPNCSNNDVNSIARAIILAIAHVYCYRLPTRADRTEFWCHISSSLRSTKVSVHFTSLLNDSTDPEAIVNRTQMMFVEKLEIQEGICMNQALTENIFVSIVCIFNKIPVFVVGKPGTSKTLALEVIQANLQGRQSPNEYWRNKPSLHFFQYQCSPMSTGNSIKYQFEAARSFQEHSSDVLTVLLLDEVGLAENSPDLPLKVLHYMLVDPPFAIVGLSNWVLDSSKMNRAICLQRPEPSERDVMQTGCNIVASVELAAKFGQKDSNPRPANLIRQNSPYFTMLDWLGPLCKAFLRVYSKQKELLNISRDFIGMRDFYSMLKFLRLEIKFNIEPVILVRAVCRNYGGHPNSIPVLLPIFFEACFPSSHEGDCFSISVDQDTISQVYVPEVLRPSAIDLVRENLTSTASRHLMILSKNETVLNLLFGCQIIDERNVSVLLGSRFKDDLDELHLITQINKVKQAMAKGKVAILLNNENIYESLYDVLNQRYVRQRDPDTGKEKLMLRLAIGKRSQLCVVEPGFKLIVIVQQSHAYDNLDLPLLNRFEKQVVTPVDVISAKALQVYDSLQSWCQYLVAETGLPSVSAIFCGFYDDTLSSLVASLTKFGQVYDAEWSNDVVLMEAKKSLLKMATTVAILHSKTLKCLISECYSVNKESEVEAFNEYITSHSHLFVFLDAEINQTSLSPDNNQPDIGKLIFLATRSPAHHFEVSLKNWVNKRKAIPDRIKADNWVYAMKESDVIILQLAHVSSERILSNVINTFYDDNSPGASKLLAILCDPLYCSMPIIAHARYLAFQKHCAVVSAASSQEVGPNKKHVLFCINLPPGLSNRQRELTLDMYPPWSYSFLEDLISQEDIGGPDLMKLLRMNLYDLCSQRLVNLDQLIINNFQSSLAQCRVHPLEDESDPRGNISYVKMIQDLLRYPQFLKYVSQCVLECFTKLKTYNDLENHVYSACENIKGTLRQSIQIAIETIVINALGHTLRQIDVNRNISWIFDTPSVNEQRLSLWLKIAHKLQPCDTIATACRDDLSKPPVNTTVLNTGLRGPFACQFPFSEKLLSFYNDSLRRQMEQQFGSNVEKIAHSLNAQLEFLLGADLVEEIYSKTHIFHSDAYYHDFVASVIYPMPFLTFVEQFHYVRTSMESLTSPSFPLISSTPGTIHAKYWYLERGMRIFTTFSALNSIRGGQQLHKEHFYIRGNIFTDLTEKMSAISSSETNTAESTADFCVRKIDVTSTLCILCYLKESILMIVQDTNRASVAQFNVYLKKWMHFFSSILTDLVIMITLVVENSILQVVPSVDINLIELANLLSKDAYTTLQTYWSLKAIHSLIVQYLILFDENGKAAPECLLDDVIDPLKSLIPGTEIDPLSSHSLSRFINACTQYPIYYPILLNCYLRKFMLPEFEMLQRLKLRTNIKFDILRMIGVLAITHQVDNLSLAEMEKANFIEVEIALHRAAIDVLFQAVKQGYIDYINTILCEFFQIDPIKALYAAQLFIERAENDPNLMNNLNLYSAEEIPNRLMDSAANAGNVLSLPLSLLSLQTPAAIYDTVMNNGYTILRQIAQVKYLLSSYSKLIHDYLVSNTSYTSMNFPVVSGHTTLQIIEPYLTAIDPQIYVFSQLVHKGGKSDLLSYLRRPNVPFLVPGAKLINMSAPQFKSIDPYSSLGGHTAYLHACSIVIQVRDRKNYNALNQWSNEVGKHIKKWGERTDILVAAIFTQITSNMMQVNAEIADNVVEWLRKDFQESTVAYGVNINIYADICHYLLSSNNLVKKEFFSRVNDPLVHNLKHHACIIAMSTTSGWLHTLLIDPKLFVKLFIPAIIDDDFASVMNVVNGSGQLMQEVGWYECSNGHKYSVGECTMPMQTANCPSCGVKIGGNNHVPVEGTKKIGKSSSLASKSIPGYNLDDTGTADGYNIGRLGKLATAALRFITHAVMLMNAELYPVHTQEMRDGICGAKSQVVELMYPRSNPADVPNSRIRTELTTRLLNDWDTLKEVTGLVPEDVATGMHMIFNSICGNAEKYSEDDASHVGRAPTDEEFARMLQEGRNTVVESEHKILIMPAATMSPPLRILFEHSFESKIVNNIFASPGSKALIKNEKIKFESDNIDITLQEHLGEYYYDILELGPPRELAVKHLRTLWRYREVVSFQEFEKFFKLKSSNENEFPIINAVLKYENSLPLIKYAADILVWHSILFKVFKPGSLSREEADAITNQDVINKLPGDERAQAEQFLGKFCQAFNATITMSGNLRECADNVFINKTTREVDLTGTQEGSMQMSPHCPISFSLPSSLKDGNDFVNPRSLCTMFILDRLKILQEMVVDALLPSKKSDVAFDDRKMELDEKIISKNLRDQHKTFKIPLTTYLTPYAVVQRRLLTYDREAHLMPSIYTYYKQDLEICRGELLGFDLKSIESDLRDCLLPSAQPFAVAVIEFTFKGELSRTGAMSILGQKIPQVELPPSILDQIWNEVDTVHRLALLTTQLEDSVAFISSSTGRTQINGDTKLNAFIQEILMIDASKWGDISCATLNTSVQLRHLKSLMHGLQEKASGDLFGTLDRKFKKPLSPQDRETCLKCGRNAKDLNILVNTLKEFLLKLMEVGLSFDPYIKKNLQYVGDGRLADYDWFIEEFPEDLKNENALEVYQLFKTM